MEVYIFLDSKNFRYQHFRGIKTNGESGSFCGKNLGVNCFGGQTIGG